jgi:hypothetical protein
MASAIKAPKKALKKTPKKTPKLKAGVWVRHHVIRIVQFAL